MKPGFQAALLAAPLVFGLAFGSPAHSSTSDLVAPVQTSGSSYGEWTVRWWQWFFSIPAEGHPVLDASGEACGRGQVDAVWFLAGTLGGTASRTCTIPAGTPIFFPVVNSIATRPLGKESLLDLRRLAAQTLQSLVDVEASVDGDVIEDLLSYRIRSPAFSVLPVARGLLPRGIVKAPASADSVVSDGIWLLLEALPVGPHDIVFRAETSDGFLVDVTYHIDVVSP